MDIVQITLLVSGIGVCLIPLKWIQSVLFGGDDDPSVWTLLGPAIGVGMIGVSLVSYHKQGLHKIFQNTFDIVDKMSMGYVGIGGIRDVITNNKHDIYLPNLKPSE